MNKKDHKPKNTPTAHVYTSAPPFLLVMGLSFALTIIIVTVSPSFLSSLKKISLPSFTHLFTRKQPKKIVFSGNESYTTIDPMLLKEYIDIQAKNILIIDTRSTAEYESGHIKGSIHIPLYSDFRMPYESAVQLSVWVSSVKKQIRNSQTPILYSYNPEADIVRVAAEKLRASGVKVKILAVSYSGWQGGVWGWIAGGELNGTLNINEYIEQKK